MRERERKRDKQGERVEEREKERFWLVLWLDERETRK